MTTQTNQGRILKHTTSLLSFAVLSVLWTYPLVKHLSTHILGDGAGDNVAFLWNFWWMRTALPSITAFFRTTYLFAPAGVDLTLHTHTALPAFAGATILHQLSVVAALNVTILVSIFGAGAATYILAWRVTRNHFAAVIAGVIFAGSPFMSAHLNGHFNLTNAWTVPLFACALSEAMRRRQMRWPALAGGVLGITIYVDYYLFVYQLLLMVCLLLLDATTWHFSTARQTRSSRVSLGIALGLVGADLCLLMIIVATGGFTFDLLGATISAHSVFNPLQALWFFVAVAAFAFVRPRLTVRRGTSFDISAMSKTVSILAGVAVAVAAPLVWKGVGLVTSGQYVSQPYFWRSAPKGIDISTLVLGNQFNGSWGRWIQSLHDAIGLNGVDESGWLGVIPMVLVGFAIKNHRRNPVVRRWTIVGVVFFVWALGPHLMAFGTNTGMILPQMLTRYVPIVSNARIPGRAMVVVYLALAVLGAVTVADMRWSSHRKKLLVSALLMIVLVADYLPAPFPSTALDRPAIYQVLRDRPEPGALVEPPCANNP